jgi:hypothetical protein
MVIGKIGSIDPDGIDGAEVSVYDPAGDEFST